MVVVNLNIKWSKWVIPTTFPLYVDDDDDLQYGECQTRDCKSNNKNCERSKWHFS